MRNCLILSIAACTVAGLASCNKLSGFGSTPERVSDSSLTHGEIVLGDKLDNPYAVANVKSAFEALYPTKASDVVTSTDLYVRFLPEDDDQLNLLKSLGIVMLDHPVDYSIVRDGDYYHDPMVSSDRITWQYAVVPKNFEFPDVRYEILESCYIADNASASTKAAAGDVDWDAVEAEAFKLTGNTCMLNQTKAGTTEAVNPSGRITVVDPDANGGQPVGVSGVRVMCNIFVKFAIAYTDRDGYYTMPKKFTANLWYRLVFKNETGFSIGFNSVVLPASSSTLGRHSPTGVDFQVDSNSERKLWRRTVVNNAVYDFFQRCSESDLRLSPPPSDLCIWMFDDSTSSCALMLHHGSVFAKESDKEIVKGIKWIVEYFSPDIIIGSKNLLSYRDIFSITVHELSHAAHYDLVGSGYWKNIMSYIAWNVLEGKDIYGDGNDPLAGYCGVAEMWAYYLQSKMYKERYGGANPAVGSTYWFHPQILTYLEERGMTASQIQQALYEVDVCDKDSFRDKLVELYPEKMTVINQVFNRYE